MDSNKVLELAKSAYPHDENLRVAYMLGVDKGYEFCREQMMKDAVEGEVADFGENFIDIMDVYTKPLNLTKWGKVKLIIVKDDDTR